MNARDHIFLLLTLGGIILMVVIDLATDLGEGVPPWHIAVEGVLASGAALGIYLIIKQSFAMRHTLRREREHHQHRLREAEQWRRQAAVFVSGLSEAIDQQLDSWALSAAEKEVAFLLLKGMSLKEIAGTRNTSEKTARAQSAAIYAKSGLAGRSELSAFFLEDLLSPTLSQRNED